MPAYCVVLRSCEHDYMARFTLDDDRVLALQLVHALAELRQRDLELSGAPDDELVATWHGRDLVLAATPRELCISPVHPIELTMRPRVPFAASVASDVDTPWLLRATAVALAGALAGILAWPLAWTFQAEGAFVEAVRRHDLWSVVPLGALLGAAVLLLEAIQHGARRTSSRARIAGMGALVGAVGAAAGITLAQVLPVSVDRSVTLARFVAWLMLGVCIGIALAACRWREGLRRIAALALGGAASGGVAALVFQVTGAGVLAQAIAFATLGAGVGLTAFAVRTVRAAAAEPHAVAHPPARGPLHLYDAGESAPAVDTPQPRQRRATVA